MKSSAQKKSSTANQSHSKAGNSFFSKKSEPAHNNGSKTASPFFDSSHMVQPQLKIHPSDDMFEKEADAMADRVTSKAQSAGAAEPNEGNPGKNIQRKTLDKISRVQRKPAFESPTALDQNSANLPAVDELPLQRKEKDSEATSEPDGFNSTLDSSKGQGSSLPEDTKEKMESGFGADFSNVKVHTDNTAASMNDQIGAKAFTHGNDIYFNRNEYKPNTSTGDHLLAHELTHTVQQTGGATSGSIQRQKGKATKGSGDDDGGGEKNPHEGKAGKVERSGNSYKLEVKKIDIPNFKAKGTPTSDIELKPRERDNKQVQTWESNFSGNATLKTKVDELTAKTSPVGDKKDTYVLKYNNGMVIGTKEELVRKLSRPFWDSGGGSHLFHVDHIHEFQLGGSEDITNFWLLDAKINVDSGAAIKKEKDAKIKTLIDEAAKESNFWPKGKPDVAEVKAGGRFKVIIKEIGPNLKGFADPAAKNLYKQDDITGGTSAKVLKPATDKELEKLGVSKTEKDVTLFLRQAGGKPYKMKKKGATEIQAGNIFLKARDGAIKVDDDTGVIQGGSQVEVEVFKYAGKVKKFLKTKGGEKAKFDVNVYSLQGLPNVGYINSQEWSKDFKEKFEAIGLSPIEIIEFDIDDTLGVVLRGKIITSIPVISDANIEFVVQGNEFYLEKVFTAEEIKVPAPFKINGLSLAIRVGTVGLEFEGYVNFSIEKVGEGQVKAFMGTSRKFGMEGEFNFNSDTFNPAKVKIKYTDGKWTIEGTLGVQTGAVKGVKEANLSVKYDDGTISFAGDGTLEVPGVDKVKLSGSYTPGAGYKIVATATLKAMPGIKSGEVTVTVFNKNNGPVILGIAGTAVPDFPAVPGLQSVTLTVFYEDGVFDVRTKVNYKKGKFDGTIEVGVTNKAVDEKGQPQGEPQKGDVVVFGYGSLTVDLFKGSTGTISVRLTPDKQLLVAGSFSVRNVKPFGDGVNIKKGKDFPSVKIPLVGIPGVSIFFEIGGGAYFTFNWDPLVLKELTISFKETNINEIETAQVDIHGEVGSKAVAEAYMELKASLGAEVLIAEIKGSLAGQAGIGVEAEAGGTVDATWNNEKGLQLKEINASVAVNPKAIFKLKGSVSVDLDLWVTTINLYYKEWTLAEGSADLSGLALKVNFPIKFDEQGNLIKPAFEQLNIEKPDFSGDQGKAALDGGINADAKKERKLAQDKLRQDIANDIRESYSKEGFSPTDYAKKLQGKYKDDAEMKAFIMDSVEEEVRKREYEEFDQLKLELKQSDLSLSQKMGKAMVFKMFRARISPSDYDSFIDELRAIEQQKQEAANQANQANQEGQTAPATA